MSLNNEQMLPERVRNMRQMKDILYAEDLILNEIDACIDRIYQRASLLHVELVNEKWLEEKLAGMTGGLIAVKKKEGSLHVEITINMEEITTVQEMAVIAFIEKWLPAHLAYNMVYERFQRAEAFFGCLWQDDEIIMMEEVSL